MKILAYAFCFLLAIIGLFAIAAAIAGGKAEERMRRIIRKNK